MARVRKPQADHRADTRGGRWAGIPHAVLNSPAFVGCDPYERAILIELVLKFDGYNNGKIVLSQRQIADRIGSSNYGRIGRSIAGLMEKGLIDVAAEGQWKQRMAREYRLTFVSTGQNGRSVPATNDYLQWRPQEKSSADPPSAAKANPAERLAARGLDAAEPVSAGRNGKLRKLSVGPAEPPSSLIGKPYPVPEFTRDSAARNWALGPGCETASALGRHKDRPPSA